MIPAPVLVEVDYWIHQRLSPGVLVALLADIESGAYRIADLEPADYTRVRELCDRYADADVGFVDAAVLASWSGLGRRSSPRSTGATSRSSATPHGYDRPPARMIPSNGSAPGGRWLLAGDTGGSD